VLVRDQNNRKAVLIERLQNLHYLNRSAAVEVAGGFIGQLLFAGLGFGGIGKKLVFESWQVWCVMNLTMNLERMFNAERTHEYHAIRR